MTAPTQNDGGAGAPIAPYLRPYREILDQFGASFEATGWKNREMQTVRFDVMIAMVDFSGRVILDAGSGQGAFAARLAQRGIEYGRFIGLDAMPEMIEQSRAAGVEEAEFHVCDFAGEMDSFSRFMKESGGPGVDVITFSGSLNTMEADEAKAVLERAWQAAREAVVYNFLSDRAPAALLRCASAPATRFPTLDLLDWALSKSPSVQFRQDYLGGHDATIAIGKPAA